MSFEVNKILDPNDIAPTLVATDMVKIVVPDGDGIRRLTIREGLRIFGYPETYNIPVKETFAFDLLGNTVVVPVVKAISERILSVLELFGQREKESRPFPCLRFYPNLAA